MKYIHKTVIVTAWLLVFVTILILFTGILALKPTLAPWFGAGHATRLHNTLLPLVFAPLFFLHSLCGTFILIQRIEWLKSKKPFQAAAGVLWTALFAFFLFLYFISPPAPKNAETKNQTASVKNESSLSNTAITLNTAEIQKHSTQDDCWMIIDSKVYNLTTYLNSHPGGPGVMLPYCGGDATKAYATKDAPKPSPHSDYAASLLDSFYIGDVGSSVDAQKVKDTQNQPASPSSRFGGEDD